MNDTEQTRQQAAREAAAAKFNGREYGAEVTREEESELKAAGLVVVVGASDDIMSFYGAINDEVGAWDGGIALIDGEGLLPARDDVDDDEELERWFTRKRAARQIEALWCKEPGYSWTFRTDIPHATFEIVEDGEPFCRGIVFTLANECFTLAEKDDQ